MCSRINCASPCDHHVNGMRGVGALLRDKPRVKARYADVHEAGRTLAFMTRRSAGELIWTGGRRQRGLPLRLYCTRLPCCWIFFARICRKEYKQTLLFWNTHTQAHSCKTLRNICGLHAPLHATMGGVAANHSHSVHTKRAGCGFGPHSRERST